MLKTSPSPPPFGGDDDTGRVARPDGEDDILDGDVFSTVALTIIRIAAAKRCRRWGRGGRARCRERCTDIGNATGAFS